MGLGAELWCLASSLGQERRTCSSYMYRTTQLGRSAGVLQARAGNRVASLQTSCITRRDSVSQLRRRSNQKVNYSEKLTGPRGDNTIIIRATSIHVHRGIVWQVVSSDSRVHASESDTAGESKGRTVKMRIVAGLRDGYNC